MGLIAVAAASVKGAFAESFREYIYCEAMNEGVLIKKGVSRTGVSSENENVITEGSVIAVNEGQFMIVVENGEIVDFCAQSGVYRYESATSPSLFNSDEFDLQELSEQIKKHFTFGGNAGRDQRVYFVNTREILNQKIGIGGVPFRDGEFNFTVRLRGYGCYSFKITDPLTFYKNVCGNVADEATAEMFAEQMRSEMQKAALPVFAALSEMHIPYDRLCAHTEELCKLLKDELSEEWGKTRGITLCSVSFSSIVPDGESAAKIAQMQESRVYTDPALLGARLGSAQANAMEKAAENTSGALNAAMGVSALNGNASASAELLKTVQSSASQKNAAGEWITSCGSLKTGN